MLLSMILATLVSTSKLDQTKIEKRPNDNQYSSYILPDDGNTIRHDFTLGNSLQQNEEEATRQREMAAKEASKRSYSNNARGQSYSGYSGEVEIVGQSWEQCIIYAKRRSGITHTIGYAGNASTQGTTPQVGSIGIEKNIGHGVYVESVEGRKITFTESNYWKGFVTRRTLDISAFRGFIYS